MVRIELERGYRDELRPRYDAFAARISALLEELTSTEGIDVAQIEHRAKTVESVLDKYDRKSTPQREPSRRPLAPTPGTVRSGVVGGIFASSVGKVGRSGNDGGEGHP